MTLVRLMDGWRELHVEVDLKRGGAAALRTLERAAGRKGVALVAMGRELTPASAPALLRPGVVVEAVASPPAATSGVLPSLSKGGLGAERSSKPLGGLSAGKAGGRAKALKHGVASGAAKPSLASERSVHHPAVDTMVRDLLAQEDLKGWMATYDRELQEFNSAALYAEVRLEETLRATAALESPNVVRTNEVYHLMSVLFQRAGPSSHILTRLLEDLSLAVYSNPASENKIPYFYSYKRLRSEFHSLKGKHKITEEKLVQRTRIATSRQAFCNRVIEKVFRLSTLSTFESWRAAAKNLKEARERVFRAILKWRQVDLLRAFNEWRQGVMYSRENRLLSRVTEIKSDNASMREEMQKLIQQNKEMLKKHNDMAADLEAERTRSAMLEKENERLNKLLKSVENAAEDIATLTHLAKKTSKTAAMLAQGQAEVIMRQTNALLDQDVAALLEKDEKVGDLYEVSPATVLTRWVNVQMRKANHPVVQNVGTDLKDGIELAVLNEVCSHGNAIANHSEDLDPLNVAEGCIRDAKAHFQLPSGVLDAEDIVAAMDKRLFPYLNHIFTASPCLEYEDDAGVTKPLMSALKEFHQAARNLEDFNGDDLEVKDLNLQLGHVIHELETSSFIVVEESSKLIHKAKEDKAAFRKLQASISGFNTKMLSALAKGEDVEIKDERADQEFFECTRLSRVKLQDILAGEEDEQNGVLDALRGPLEQHYMRLKNTYKYYAKGGAMSNGEFWKFVKESKLTTKKFFGAQVDSIFSKANLEYDEAGRRKAQTVDQEDDNPDFELTNPEFLECIVRIAHQIVQGGKGKISSADPFVKILESNVFKNALSSEADEFKGMLNGKKMREILKKHRPNMSKLFKTYAAADTKTNAAAAATGTMNQSEVVQLMKDCRIIGNGIDMGDLKFMFGLVQDDDGNEDDDSEMVFTEFIELLCCSAFYRYPNPYTPTYKRIDNFIGKDICKVLSKKVKLEKSWD